MTEGVSRDRRRGRCLREIDRSPLSYSSSPATILVVGSKIRGLFRGAPAGQQAAKNSSAADNATVKELAGRHQLADCDLPVECRRLFAILFYYAGKLSVLLQ